MYKVCKVFLIVVSLFFIGLCNQRVNAVSWSGYTQVGGVGSVGDGAGVAFVNLDSNARPEMILMAYDDPDGGNKFRYKIGWNVNVKGKAASWSGYIQVGGVGNQGEGAGIAFVNLDTNPRPEMILMAYDAPSGGNKFRYKIGWNVNVKGKAASWSRYIQVDGVGSVGDGADIAFVNLDSNARPEMILMAYDDPDGGNKFRYKIGWNVNANGKAASWSGYTQVGGVGNQGEGAGIAFVNLDSNARPEMILMAYDAPSGGNKFRYKIGWNVKANGKAASWSNYIQVDGVGSVGDGAGVAFVNLDNAKPEMILMAYDDPDGGNKFRYRVSHNFSFEYEAQAALKKGERYSFESYNFSGYFIRHELFLGPKRFLGEITKIKSLWDKKDASFVVVPGLADNRYISFESLNLPGYFLRHQGFRLKLHKSSNDQGFKKDATFKVKPGLAFDSLVSFESLNYPGRYIRHRDFHLYLEKGNDNLFRKDATFRINPATIWVEAPTSFTYISSDFPKNQSCKTYDNIQGITHDDDYWYFSQSKTTWKARKNHPAKLYKFNASDNLSNLSRENPVISKKLEGYGDHPGDITYFKRGGAEYIFVPMYKKNEESTTSRILVFRASDLELVVASDCSSTIYTPSWVAVDPSGRLYHNNNHILPESNKRIQVYDVDWNKIANKDPSFLTHLGEFPLYREDGTEFATDDGSDNYRKQLNYQQGAAFSPNGNLFFMSHGGKRVPASLSGIKVFDAQTGQIIFGSSTAMPFKFQFDPTWPYKSEEPQGLTVWDLDDPKAPDAPNISGQLHVILLRNDWPGYDDMYIKHYRVPYGERCRLLDRKAGFIGTVRNEFHQGVRGATITFVSENGQVSKTIKSHGGGRYAITLPKLTRYSVEIKHPDYHTLSNKWHVLNECGHQSSNFTLRGDVPPPTGVRGRVTDMRNNQPVRGADICATEQQTLRRYCVKTNNSGYYSISAPVDSYTVHTSHPSYKAASKNVNITRGYAQAHFKLKPKPSTPPGGSGSLPPKRKLY